MNTRQRRIIYNNDGGDVMIAGADTPEAFLAKRMAGIVGSQVDSVFYCTGATTMFTHEARVGEVYGEFIGEKSSDSWRATKENLAALRRGGHDVLKLVIDFCHAHGIEIVWTHRINDIHDSMTSCAEELSRWKREHPEFCLGRADAIEKYDMNSPRYWWSALDFERPEVLEYLYRIDEDVYLRYDIDGIEIDYFRSPMFFRPNLDFEPATDAQVGIMTNFQRRIRELARREGKRRGREMLVATRVPMTRATCRHVGVDIAAWLREGLLDVLTAGGGYVPFTMPTAELVALGHEHGVPVYPAISDSGLRNRYQCAGAWRGAAANALAAGADGVYTFNIWANRAECPKVSLLDLQGDMGSLATLAGMDKVFAVDNFPILEGDLVQAIEQSQILPMMLEPWGKQHFVTLVVGEDLASSGQRPQLRLGIQVGAVGPNDLVQITWNGRTLKSPATGEEPGWMTFTLAPAEVRRGANEVGFRVLQRPGGLDAPIVVRAVELTVNYH